MFQLECPNLFVIQISDGCLFSNKQFVDQDKNTVDFKITVIKA